MRLSSVCLACTLVAVPLWAVAAPRAVYLGTYQIPDRVEYLGGFSGLEFSDDGKSFVALSDSAALASGTVTRDERGAITGVSFDGPPVRLKDAKGALLTDPEDDSEGLAFAPDGSLYISFELMNRVAKFGRDGVLIETLPVPREFYGFEYNAGPEALAIAPDGAIFTLPEGDAGGMASDPMFRFRGWRLGCSVQDWRGRHLAACRGGFRAGWAAVSVWNGISGRWWGSSRDCGGSGLTKAV
jgi:hypothetical protein